MADQQSMLQAHTWLSTPNPGLGLPIPTEYAGAGSNLGPTNDLHTWLDDNEREFQALWSRAWTSSKFRDYRTGTSLTRSGRKSKEDKEWSDMEEEMFFRAIVKFYPIGRLQVLTQDQENMRKRFGRNQLIAKCLNEWLGLHPPIEYRDVHNRIIPKKTTKQHPEAYPQPHPMGFDRKIIMSHLQVLRKKFADDQWILDNYLIKNRDDTERLDGAGSDQGSRPSPNSAEPTESPVFGSSSRPNSINIPRELTRLSPRELGSNFFEPSQFSISLTSEVRYLSGQDQAIGPSTTAACRVMKHCLTATRLPLYECQSASGAIMSETRFRMGAPHVVAHCDSYAAESSLSLPDFDKNTVGQVGLRIRSILTTAAPLDASLEWIVRTKFFEAGARPSWLDPGDSHADSTQHLRIDEHGNPDGRYHHHAAFGGAFWSALLSRLYTRPTIDVGPTGETDILATSRQQYRGHGHSFRQTDHAGLPVQCIDRLTAVQELVAVESRTGSAGLATRHLCIYWKFRRTRHPSEEGQTTFRRLSPVSATNDATRFPPSMSLATAAGEAFRIEGMDWGGQGPEQVEEDVSICARGGVRAVHDANQPGHVARIVEPDSFDCY